MARFLDLAIRVVCCPVFVAVAPLVLVLAYLNHRRQTRFAARMRSRGRLLTEQELATRISEGQGTVILQLAHGLARAWWTPDDVRAVCPHVLPGGWRDVGAKDLPFTHWCYDRYLDVLSGTAYLVQFQGQVLVDIESLPRVEVPYVDELQ